jgi:hypothetical protein
MASDNEVIDICMLGQIRLCSNIQRVHGISDAAGVL